MKLQILIFTLVVVLFLSCNESKDVARPVVDASNLASAELLQIFPAKHSLNKNISQALIDANSDAILEFIGLNTGLTVNFGSGETDGVPVGIPYTLVGENEDSVNIKYSVYVSQSDTGALPIPIDAPIEGNGNSRVIVVDVFNSMLYELAGAKVVNGEWNASAGAKFNIATGRARREGWISADAAGLPIFPCLVRYPEVETGVIDHAIRFTLPQKNIYAGYVFPARHNLQGTTNKNQLPFGAKLKLKADFDISGFSKTNQVILKAMQTYGLILADVGKSMQISGAPSEKWNNEDLKELNKVKVSDFEVVKLGKIRRKKQ